MEFYFQRVYKGPVKAVILDWAGTTMDFGCFAPAVVFIEVFKNRNVPITIEQAREPMGAHKKVHIRQISQIPAVAKKWEEVHGKPCTEDDIESMFQEFVPLQLKCLADYADLIPGMDGALKELRARGLKIGSTTGYTGEMMELLLGEAKKRGYVPDASCCATQVPAGRPHPWMCIRNAIDLQIYPMESIVKIGDTLPDIDEGLNAGMWTIGLAATGNELGMTYDEYKNADPAVLKAKLDRAYTRMAQSGAHYVVDSITDIFPCLDDINARLARGERP